MVNVPVLEFFSVPVADALAVVTVAFPAVSVSVPVPEYVVTFKVPVALSFFSVADAPESVVTATLPVDALFIVAPEPDCVAMVNVAELLFLIVPVAVEVVTVMFWEPATLNVPAPLRLATVRAALPVTLMVPPLTLTLVTFAAREDIVIVPPLFSKLPSAELCVPIVTEPEPECVILFVACDVVIVKFPPLPPVLTVPEPVRVPMVNVPPSTVKFPVMPDGVSRVLIDVAPP